MKIVARRQLCGFLLASFVALVACQKEVVKEVVKDGENRKDQGTYSGAGGGNSLNGRVLESYRVNIEALPEFNDVVKPVLLVVDQKSPAMAQVMREALRGKPWYMGPGKLTQLPSEKLGVAFRTDQTVIHTRLAVWFDKQSYEQLPAKDRGILLVHEILMALRIEQIMAGKDELSEALKDRNIRDLSATDHEAVRMLTSDLIDGRTPANPVQFVELFAKHGFGSFVPGREPSEHFPTDKILPIQFIFNYLQSQKLSTELPVFGSQISDKAKRNFDCEHVFTVDEKSGLGVAIYEKDSIANSMVKLVSLQTVTPSAVQYDNNWGNYFDIVDRLERGKDLGDIRWRVRLVLRNDKVARIVWLKDQWLLDPKSGWTKYYWETRPQTSVGSISCERNK